MNQHEGPGSDVGSTYASEKLGRVILLTMLAAKPGGPADKESSVPTSKSTVPTSGTITIKTYLHVN